MRPCLQTGLSHQPVHPAKIHVDHQGNLATNLDRLFKVLVGHNPPITRYSGIGSG